MTALGASGLLAPASRSLHLTASPSWVGQRRCTPCHSSRSWYIAGPRCRISAVRSDIRGELGIGCRELHVPCGADRTDRLSVRVVSVSAARVCRWCHPSRGIWENCRLLFLDSAGDGESSRGIAENWEKECNGRLLVRFLPREGPC